VPVVAILDQASFWRTTCVEEILHTVNGLCAGEDLAIFTVEILSGSIFAQPCAVAGSMVSLM